MKGVGMKKQQETPDQVIHDLVAEVERLRERVDALMQPRTDSDVPFILMAQWLEQRDIEKREARAERDRLKRDERRNLDTIARAEAGWRATERERDRLREALRSCVEAIMLYHGESRDHRHMECLYCDAYAAARAVLEESDGK